MIRKAAASDVLLDEGRACSAWTSKRLLYFVLLNGVCLNILLGAATYLLLLFGWLPRGVMSNSLTLLGIYFLRGKQGTDSWGPMFEALRAHAAHLPIYDTVFFANHTKFQYPLTSLLPLYALHSIGISEESLLKLLNAASWFAVWGTVAFACLILLRSARTFGPVQVPHASTRRRLVLSGIVAGLLFFPVTWAYNLGQIQVFLSLAFAAAIYCWMSGREKWSGVLVACLILLKPQYAVFLLWFALRKKTQPLLASFSVLGLSAAASVVVFGWHDHVRYLEVISYMGKHGEVFYYNLSVNGFLNRLLLNGNSLQYTIHSFPPMNRLVYTLTMLSSGLFVITSLVYPLFTRARAGVEDFIMIALSMTLASPIAWDHHYGILLAGFAYCAGRLQAVAHIKLLAVSYVLLSNAWSPLNMFANKPLLNVLQSLPFLGVLLFLGFLYLETAHASPQTDECPTTAIHRFLPMPRFSNRAAL